MKRHKVERALWRIRLFADGHQRDIETLRSDLAKLTSKVKRLNARIKDKPIGFNKRQQ